MAGIARKKLENLSAPISVFLNVTQECNMRCAYCCAEAARPHQRSGHEMNDEEYLAIVDQLLEAKVFTFILTGGEPLIRHDLIFGILDKIGPRGSVQLNTNATLVNDAVAKRLADFPGPLRVVTSIDAPIEEVNALTRGKGYLAKTLRGVDKLIEYGIKPKVNCVLTLHNYRYVPQLVDLLKSRGLKSLGTLHFQPMGYGICREAELKLPLAEREVFNRELAILREAQSDFKISDQDEQNWFGHEETYKECVSRGLSNREPRNLLPCSAGIDQCAIQADGSITPCNYWSRYRCGNVREEKFIDVWRHSPELILVRALRSVPVTEIDQCVGCKYSVLCQGGCRAMGYVSTGSLTGLDPSCPHFERRSGRVGTLPLLNQSWEIAGPSEIS